MAGKDKSADAFEFEWGADDGKEFGAIPGEDFGDGIEGFEQLPEQNGFMGAADANDEFTDVQGSPERFGGSDDARPPADDVEASAGFADENERSEDTDENDEDDENIETFGEDDHAEREDGAEQETEYEIGDEETAEDLTEDSVPASNGAAKKRALFMAAASIAALGVAYVGYATVLPMFTGGSAAPKAPVARPQTHAAAPNLNSLPAFPPAAKPQAPAIQAQPPVLPAPAQPSLIQPSLVQQPQVAQQPEPQIEVPTGSLNRPSQIVEPTASAPSAQPQVAPQPAPAAQDDSLKAIATSVSQVLAEVREVSRRIGKLEEESASKTDVAKLESRIAALEGRGASKVDLPVRPAAPVPSPRPALPPSAPSAAAETFTQPKAARGAGILPPLKPAVVDGYSLKGVSRGVAWISASDGIQEVSVGRTLPGAGLIKAIENVGGEWVVVAERGVIVP